MEPGTLESLIKRYEAGERDPALVKALNDAAWDGFHDPWERAAPGPEPTPAPAPADETEAAMDEDLNAVLPFSLATIERHLADREFTYWKSVQTLAVMVYMGYDQPSDRSIRIQHSVQGGDGSVYQLKMMGDRRVERADFGRALALCNHWNASYRWPRAFLEIPKAEEDGPEPGSALLAMDYQLCLAKGIHQALFDDLVGCAIGASFDFFKMAKEAFQL